MQTSGCNFGVHYELSDCTKLPKSVVTCDSVSVNNPNCSISGFNWYKWLKTGYEISRLWGSELFCYETMGYKQGFNFLCTTCTIRTINPFCFKFLKKPLPSGTGHLQTTAMASKENRNASYRIRVLLCYDHNRSSSISPTIIHVKKIWSIKYIALPLSNKTLHRRYSR